MLQIEDLETIFSDFEGRLFETYRSNDRIENSNILALSFLKSEIQVIMNVVYTLEQQCKCDYLKFGRYQEKTLRILIRLINRMKILQPLLEQKTIRSEVDMSIQYNNDDFGTELLMG